METKDEKHVSVTIITEDKIGKEKHIPFFSRETLEAILFIFNLLKNLMGQSMLSFPWALHKTGLFLGSLVTFSVCFMSSYVFYLANEQCEKTGSSDWAGIFDDLYDKPKNNRILTIFLNVNVIILNFSTCICYIIVIGDTVPLFLNFFGLDYPRWIIICFISLFILLPISALPNLDNIRQISFVGVICLFIIIIGSFVLFGKSGKVSSNVAIFPPMAMPCFVSIPIFGAVFDAHANAPRFSYEYNYVAKGVKDRISYGYVIAIAFGMCAFITLIFGIIGNLQFGVPTENILNSHQQTIFTSIMRLCGAISVMISYAMFFNSLRISVYNLYVFTMEKVFEKEAKDLRFLFRIILTVILVGLTTLVGCLVDKLGSFGSTMWALTGSTIVYLFPIVAAYKLNMLDTPFKKVRGVIIATFGVVMSLIFGFITSVLLWAGKIEI